MIDEKRAHKYCRDDLSKIENYEKAIDDNTQTWHLHHRLELTLDGEPALTAAQLKLHDMYYNPNRRCIRLFCFSSCVLSLPNKLVPSRRLIFSIGPASLPNSGRPAAFVI